MSQDMKNAFERSQIPTMKSFSRLPGYFPRKKEEETINRILSGVPCFTILFGASSVGKTALLRQVLTEPQFHVMHFDLRIAGFADKSSLFIALTYQFEKFFQELGETLPFHEDLKKDALAFKHARLDFEKMVEKTAQSPAPNSGASVADVASLMEKFQASLLHYWRINPEKVKKEREQTADKNDLDGKPDNLENESSDARTGKLSNEQSNTIKATDTEEIVKKKVPVTNSISFYFRPEVLDIFY